MKLSVWDILTGLTLLGIVCLLGAFGVILVNPSVGFNPLKPAVLATVAPIVLPSATPTEIGLPPTWTPTVDPAQGEPAVGAPTLRPSRTPEPTPTRFVLPTFTPSTAPRATSVRTGLGTGGDCTIVYQYPPDDTTLTHGSAFDMRWTLKNTSSTSWRSDTIDIRFVSGDRMHNSSYDVQDMDFDVASGSAFDLVVPMIVPSTGDSYTSYWALMAGNTAVCRFFIAINGVD